MWLLNWLLGKSSNVISLVSTYYGRIIDAAKNALAWARKEAANALSAAKAYVITKYNELKASLTALIDYVLAVATALYAAANALANILVDKAKALLLGLINGAKVSLTALINSAVATVYSYVSPVIEFLKPLLLRIRAAADFVFDRLLVVWDQIELVVSFLGEVSILSRLMALLGFLPLITQWFTNPLGTLIAYLRPMLLELIQFSVAYALGTVKYNLPPWPSWGSGLTVQLPSGGTTPGKGGLAPPLSRIYVSGNAFNSPPGHMGIDLGLTAGQTIYAMHGGKVSRHPFDADGYGYYVTIKGGDWWTLYAHCESIGLDDDETVEAGQAIARGDTTGNSTGNHLHLEIKYRSAYVNPINYL